MVAETMVRGALRLHQAIYRRSDGRFGRTAFGRPALLLTTTGRRSGTARTVALAYLERDGELAVVASDGGRDRHPGWYLNLVADPRATVQIGRHRRPVHARVADPAERARLWPALNAMNRGGYDRYQAKTARQIPVVLLRPVTTIEPGSPLARPEDDR